MRFHCWVLVLSGKREVAQSFFLEPTTGEAHPLNWDEYLGIESVWNHKNYWINMQDCSQGVKVNSILSRNCCMHCSKSNPMLCLPPPPFPGFDLWSRWCCKMGILFPQCRQTTTCNSWGRGRHIKAHRRGTELLQLTPLSSYPPLGWQRHRWRLSVASLLGHSYSHLTKRCLVFT